MFTKHGSIKRADEQSVREREKFPVRWAGGGGLAKRLMAGFALFNFSRLCYAKRLTSVVLLFATFVIVGMTATGRVARAEDVGVIAGHKGCGNYPTVIIHMDDEDSKNKNDHGGWIGAIHQNRNTTFTFCKVDGKNFKPRSYDYAVLRLGENCPSDSTEFSLLIHNEKSRNNNSWEGPGGIKGEDENGFDGYFNTSIPNSCNQGNCNYTGWTKQKFLDTKYGGLDPIYLDFPKGFATYLRFCYFSKSSSGDDNNPTTIILGDDPLNIQYGFFSASVPSNKYTTGWVYTDDQDDNLLLGAPSSDGIFQSNHSYIASPTHIEGQVKQIISADGNTTFHIATLTANLTQDIGVIPNASGCPAGVETVAIHMDDEDKKNANDHGGWIGATSQDGNTTFVFCRAENGSAFSSMKKFPIDDITGLIRKSYAVLKLGDRCPNGSKEFVRTFDNEDTNVSNSSSGNIYPNISDRNTVLYFCLFEPQDDGKEGNPFPLIGFDYGVFAPPSSDIAIEKGWLHTDDQDGSDNIDSFWFGSANSSIANSIISGDDNTDIYFARVRGGFISKVQYESTYLIMGSPSGKNYSWHLKFYPDATIVCEGTENDAKGVTGETATALALALVESINNKFGNLPTEDQCYSSTIAKMINFDPMGLGNLSGLTLPKGTVLSVGPAGNPNCNVNDQVSVGCSYNPTITYIPNDTDADGLPDEWESKYFGDLSQDGDSNYDGDGLSNVEEYLEGTDPTTTITGDYRIYGKVSDKIGNPITEVMLQTIDRVAITDDAGYWEVPNLPEGHYVITVFKEGYEAISQGVEISNGQDMEVNLILSSLLKIDATYEREKEGQGERITYTMTVTNTGIKTATGIVLTDIIPVDTHLLSLETAIDKKMCDKDTTLCTLPDLASQASTQAQLVIQNKKGEATINTAMVSADNYPPDIVVTTIEDKPYLTVSVHCVPNPVEVLKTLHCDFDVDLSQQAIEKTAKNVKLVTTLPNSVELDTVKSEKEDVSCDTSQLPVVTCSLSDMSVAGPKNTSQIKVKMDMLLKDAGLPFLIQEVQVSADNYPVYPTQVQIPVKQPAPVEPTPVTTTVEPTPVTTTVEPTPVTTTVEPTPVTTTVEPTPVTTTVEPTPVTTTVEPTPVTTTVEPTPVTTTVEPTPVTTTVEPTPVTTTVEPTPVTTTVEPTPVTTTVEPIPVTTTVEPIPVTTTVEPTPVTTTVEPTPVTTTVEPTPVTMPPVVVTTTPVPVTPAEEVTPTVTPPPVAEPTAVVPPTPSVVFIPITACPTEGDLTVICNAYGQTLKVEKILPGGQVSNGVLEGSLTNQGWVSNLTITTTGKLIGGTVTGYIKNQGVMLDFEFRGMSIIGGSLGGIIRNTSKVGGFFQEVTLLPNTQITGGTLKGTIKGDQNSPALLKQVRIKSGSHLSGVKLGKGVKLEKGVVVEKE